MPVYVYECPAHGEFRRKLSSDYVFRRAYCLEPDRTKRPEKAVFICDGILLCNAASPYVRTEG